MKKRFIFVTGLALSLAFAALFTHSADTSAKSAELAALLPDSDGVMTINTERLIDSALPSMLASNPRLMLKIDSEVQKFKQNSGMDLKSFDQIAVGLRQTKAGKASSFDMVLLARGSSAVTDLERVADLASKGEFTKTTVGSRTVYLFSGAKLIKDKKPGQLDGSVVSGTADQFMASLSGELALTAYDSNTLAFGNKERVMETIGNSKRVSSELLSVVQKNAGSLGTISMSTPGGVSDLIELDDDDLGEMLNSIRSMHGTFDVVDGVTKARGNCSCDRK